MRHATIKTAVLLSDEEKYGLKKRFEAFLEEPAECVFEVDPSVIGGFLAYVDGMIYDMSIKTKLKDIHTETHDLIRKSEVLKTAEQPFYSETVYERFMERLKELDSGPREYKYGIVQSCADGIVVIDGLSDSRYGEILMFENGAFGMALDLSKKGVGAVLFSDANHVRAGGIVRGTGRVVDVKVGRALLGRTVDPLGRPLDGMPLVTKQFRPLESPAPGIMDRAPVSQPMQTGILAIDSMIPVGKGQRELIIGDRQTGKTSIALSAMLNQSKNGVICVYCAIAQKASSVAMLVNELKERGAYENCIIVVSTASDSAAMQYITPYVGCSIGEYFMYMGRDVLIVYDDLSKHAMSYRTLSLLLKRPPGREAYPGDVFYLHSRLLERAAKLSDEKGGGSMTALPIIETVAGDISAYIPTNVISITDGQIYLDSEIFHSGVRPALDVGLSVSRVGRSAQTKAMKAVSGQLRIQLAQYRELSVFSQFDSDLDKNTRRLLNRGERLAELMKQDKNIVFELSEQVAVLLAYERGMFDSVPVSGVIELRRLFCEYLRENENVLMDVIDRTGELSDNTKETLLSIIDRFAEMQLKKGDKEGADADA